MKIMVLNCGSSSIKYQFIDMTGEEVLVKGVIDRIGHEDAILKYSRKEDREFTELKKVLKIDSHEQAMRILIDILINKDHGVIKHTSEIGAIGHRVVHGGEKFDKAVLITDEVKNGISECFELAPLHNPRNYEGIEICEKLLPNIPQVAVFDTAFHQTMPDDAALYAIPYRFYSKYNIRRYGFHGPSHYYVASRAAELMKKKTDELKIITCHLGNGASVAAVKHSRSVETSMGFTPLEGLVMGSRCGDIDPAVVTYLMDREEISVGDMSSILNKQSGLYGLSGISNDMREIIDEVKKDNERARLAVRVFVHRIKKYIGAYAAVMNGMDVLVFCGGIGENSPFIRELCCRDMEYTGIELDKERNGKACGTESLISSAGSRVRVFSIPTNEELVIARETEKCIKS